MPRYDARCLTCGWAGEVVTEPHAVVGCPVCGEFTERVWTEAPRVVDDTLPGAPRWIEHLDHEPVWVETKTQLQAELDKRELRLKESPNRNRHDASPWATATTLKSSALPDPHLEALAARARAAGPPVVERPAIELPPGHKRLEPAEVELIVAADKVLRGFGMQMALSCRVCQREHLPCRVVAHNPRGTSDWGMRCGHQEWRHFHEVRG